MNAQEISDKITALKATRLASIEAGAPLGVFIDQSDEITKLYKKLYALEPFGRRTR